MLLQTNSYVVPKDRRSEHARLLRRFRQTLARLGCESFEVYEQVGANWNSEQAGGRFVQIMRFRDRRHQLSVQEAERSDPAGQALIAEFCALINFPYQQEHGFFAVGFYTSVLPVAPSRAAEPEAASDIAEEEMVAAQANSAEETNTAGMSPSSQESDAGESAVDESAMDSGDQNFPRAADARREQAPAPIDAEYVERDLDEMVKTFGEVPINDPAGEHPSAQEHADSGNGDSGRHPSPGEAEEDRWIAGLPPATVPGAPADEDNFSSLLESHFGRPAADPSSSRHPSGHGAPASGGSGIGSVLDGGVLDDTDLDIPLLAELINEAEEPKSHAPESRPSRRR